MLLKYEEDISRQIESIVESSLSNLEQRLGVKTVVERDSIFVAGGFVSSVIFNVVKAKNVPYTDIDFFFKNIDGLKYFVDTLVNRKIIPDYMRILYTFPYKTRHESVFERWKNFPLSGKIWHKFKGKGIQLVLTKKSFHIEIVDASEKIKVNFVHHLIGDPFDIIRFTFDLSPAQCAYDIESKHLIFMEGFIASLFYESIVPNHLYRPIKYYRIVKYAEKGFKVIHGTSERCKNDLDDVFWY